MKHFVYIIKFITRIENKTPPYYYIGSKTNATYVDGVILNDRGVPYYGSSRYKNYKEYLNNSIIEVDILHKTNNVSELLELELYEQKKVKAKTNPLYFNLGYASKNTFNKCGYGTYKHHITGKIVRLKTNNPLVLNKTYIGATTGYKQTTETKNKISKASSGKNNGFYNRKHTKETKNKISKSNSGLVRSKEFKENVSKRFKNVPKSEEHKRKIGRSGLIMLKHPITNHSVRVNKTEKAIYESMGYLNPYTISIKNAPNIKCPYCEKTSKSKSNMVRWHFDNCKRKPK